MHSEIKNSTLLRLQQITFSRKRPKNGEGKTIGSNTNDNAPMMSCNPKLPHPREASVLIIRDRQGTQIRMIVGKQQIKGKTIIRINEQEFNKS